VLLRFQPTLVYTNTSTIISGAFASKVLRLPHFWHVHENFDTMEIPIVIPRKALQKIMESMSDKVIFVSYLALKSIFPNGSGKAVVVHNGIDLSRFKFSNRSVTKVNRPCICFLGALADRKGVDILLLALALLKHENGREPCLDIWGSGDPEYCRLLKNIADELGIADYVRFMGHTISIDEILPEYDVLVVPSRGESFSLVALEGMAAGVPVVATKCGGPEEFIDDRQNGLLVDVGDYRSMAGAINTILDDPALGRRLAAEGRNRVSRCFDLDMQLETLFRVALPPVR
jgi:glycosyltransferase involved in cell wall biosynthesis